MVKVKQYSYSKTLVWEVLSYMCYFDRLMNKAAFGQWFKQRYTERVGGIREKSCSHHRRQMPSLEAAKILLVGHNLMVMHRLIEMG